MVQNWTELLPAHPGLKFRKCTLDLKFCKCTLHLEFYKHTLDIMQLCLVHLEFREILASKSEFSYDSRPPLLKKKLKFAHPFSKDCIRGLLATLLIEADVWLDCNIKEIHYCNGPKFSDRLKKFITVMVLNFRTDRSGQTVQTQIRLLLEEQSDQGLHCLQFPLPLLDALF